MRIELELPDWVVEGPLYVLAGIELAAYRGINKEWKIKTERCHSCGTCCKSFNSAKPSNSFPPTTKGVCNYLKDNKCSFGFHRPFSCCISIGTSMYGECAEKYDI